MRLEALERSKHKAGRKKVHNEEVEPEKDPPRLRFLGLHTCPTQQSRSKCNDQSEKTQSFAGPQKQAEQRQGIA